jgi:predicted aconitase
MELTDTEKAMLDGRDGRAKAKAMELLVRYGGALGAERLVETKNVAGTWAVSPFMKDFVARGMDAVYSEFNLDSDEVVETPHATVSSCQLIAGVDHRNWRIQGVPEEGARNQANAEAYFGKRGIQQLATCTPYQVGNVPVRDEHCAWMESSAVVYCNAVLGARTNTEGRESTGAASITGRIPYWGFHIPECRHATHEVEVEFTVDDMMDWGLLGYHIGEAVEEDIPLLTGIRHTPSLIKLKHFGAAAASSGGVEMYHIPGTTPEAPTREAALGGKAPRDQLKFGQAERRRAYENLNTSARDRDVDFIMLGCPHNSIEQMWLVASLLDGKRISANTQLWVHTPHAIREVAKRSGYTKVIEDAGGHVMSDTCPAISRFMPKGTRVTCTDSAKQAHYLPAILGIEAWFGTLEECVSAAVTGQWNGELN